VILKNKVVFFLHLILMAAIALASPCLAENTNAQTLPTYNLSISFNLKENSLKGVAEIIFPEPTDIVVSTGNLTIIAAAMDGKPVEYSEKEGLIRTSGKGSLEIKYEGIFRGEQGKVKNFENPGVVSGGIISAQGISLTGNWYPTVRGLAYYRLSALVPADFVAISEADEISFKKTPAGKEYSFSFPHPLTGIDFAAANYKEVKGSIGGIDIYAYFFPEDVSLADTYIQHAKTFLETYNALLVPYPYKRFTVVENVLSTGYSMPTFTLLGRDIIRFPFIVQESLGHEITHQWFGNYVYADFMKGNWLEAITTYLSDYRYAEQKGEGWEYRKKILTDYQSYIRPEKDFPLRDFVGRTDFASKAIGYGKGTMFFHMLENLVGEEAFYRALRSLIGEYRFRHASWEDIRKSFERISGKDLGWFFSQWLDRKGVPSIIVRDPMALVLKGSPSATFRLEQTGEPYRLNLPIYITAEKGTMKMVIESAKKKQYFEIATRENPRTLVIDKDYDIMRRLGEDEFPPVISRLLGDDKRLIVYSEKEKDIYGDLIDLMKGYGFVPKQIKDLKDGDIQTSSLLVLGHESPVLERLFGKGKDPGPGFFLTVRDNPLNRAKVVAYVNAGSREEVSLAANKIFHYGKYSTLRFNKGVNVEKVTAGTERGMEFTLAEPMRGVVPEKSLPIKQIINSVSETPVIFIGERHMNYEDHKVELDVIIDMFEKGRKFAIGMEMFQRPFQHVIDDYLSGEIDERQFLKRSEYFRRWKFDYNLYREIIEFAKANRIPIVALNIRDEIVKKVASGGLDSLSEEEMKEIPVDMDMYDNAYRKMLMEIFENHPPGPAFANFYQAQILWDETMAHSAADFLERSPDYQIVILAGEGHIMYGSGIPQRLNRLTGKEYVTLINGTFDDDIGNYVIFADPVEPPFSAKLGVLLNKKDGHVVIEGIAPGSPALKAGLKKEDILVSVDGWKIETVDDAKIALFDKKPFENVQVKVTRKRFLFGDQELEFNVPL
jgi:aminopeptidase N